MYHFFTKTNAPNQQAYCTGALPAKFTVAQWSSMETIVPAYIECYTDTHDGCLHFEHRKYISISVLSPFVHKFSKFC
jgi:hypothetical protein